MAPALVLGVAAMKVYQRTDFTGKVVTNVSTVFAATGVFAVVPKAFTTEPVPYWQLTNYVDNRITAVLSLVSGECDTNRVDILFSTNYTVTGVCVCQPSALSRTVYVYTNAVQVDSFTLSTLNDIRTFATPISITRYHRLGIAVSATNSVVSFCFEGRRQ